ncbi:hypothetical protein HK102_009464, partial [Quaeritorhiza haematococci]
LPEGLILYTTSAFYPENPALGFLLFLALAIHNLVEGFAISLPIYLGTSASSTASEPNANGIPNSSVSSTNGSSTANGSLVRRRTRTHNNAAWRAFWYAAMLGGLTQPLGAGVGYLVFPRQQGDGNFTGPGGDIDPGGMMITSGSLSTTINDGPTYPSCKFDTKNTHLQSRNFAKA